MTFPETKYMGSKQAILPFIFEHIRMLRFKRVLDAFSGSGCVAYTFKQLGCEVHTNDFLRLAFHIAHAAIENDHTRLTDEDLEGLLRGNRKAIDFIQRTFRSLYFTQTDNAFLDNLWANIQELQDPYKRSLALAAACKAAMKKRPRGIFTFTGRKGWDGRADLRLSMEDQFVRAVAAFNDAVCSNGRRNKAMVGDVFEVEPEGYDLVYIDTPYVSPYSDCDYTRRYHFVEGFCSYWRDAEIMAHTKTKKIRSYPTAFSRKATVLHAFRRLFDHFRRSTLVVSYSSNGIPSKDQMTQLLREAKSCVKVYENPHKYSFGNHNHKVGDNNNSVLEYLFVAQ